MGEECCFPFIDLLDLDVVPPADVHNHELGASAKMINDLRNEGGYISVFLCPFV